MSQQTQIFFTEAQRHDALIAELLSDSLGALGPSFEQKRLLAVLQFHKGAANAIMIRDLSRRCEMSDRAIKEAIRSLRVDFGMRIGSSKSATTGGYYLILTDEERRASADLPRDEIRSQAQWLRVLEGDHYVLDLLNQVSLEIKGEK